MAANAISRRIFLKRIAAPSGAVAGAIGAVPCPANVAVAPPPAGYRSLSLDDSAFVEAMINVMCPADHYCKYNDNGRARVHQHSPRDITKSAGSQR